MWFLVTSEGDKLNLKSKLCQLIGLTEIIEGGKIDEAEIVCTNPEDDSFCSALTFTATRCLRIKKKQNKNRA